MLPPSFEAIRRDTDRIGFTMASDPLTGALLRTLAASKPGGRMLELGTGTGVGTAWILDGMDREARLTSVDTDSAAQDIARRHLGADNRVTFVLGDGAAFLDASDDEFDLIYADAWPGKFSHLNRALERLRVGGIYVIDDLLPQQNWPDGHAPKVASLIAHLESRLDLVAATLAWSTGVMIAVKVQSTALASG
jgi:predicted O-methyltransferase YrrM